jgi:hypothetical protein
MAVTSQNLIRAVAIAMKAVLSQNLNPYILVM